jgi:isopenicillin N synthase-like dioxygenase
MADALPVIDIAPLVEGKPEGERRVAAEIGAACRGIGFFLIRNHGVPDAVLDGAFAAGDRFFARPEAEKRGVSIERSRHNRGYVPFAGERLDPSRPGDAKEAFNIGRDLAPDDPDVVAGTPFHGVNQWPDVPGFRDALLAYFAAMQDLCGRLHRAFAIDLGLEPDFFADRIDRPLATLRLLHYPPHPGAFDGGLYGAAPHTDYGNVTVLAQDDAGGLQVKRRDGGWIDAPPLPGTFVCNIGDCLMRWSNDVYVSTPHRVVNLSGRERRSIAFFCDPNADAEVACLPTCAGPDRPPRYPPTTGAAYLKERLDATYAFRKA